MSGAGFIGTSPQSLKRRKKDKSGISAVLVPATSDLVVGQSLSDTANWTAFLDPANYGTPASGGSIAAVTVGYTGSTTEAAAAFADGDTNAFSITVSNTAGTVRTFSTVPRRVVHAAPAVTGTLSDQDVTRATGPQIYDAAFAFAGGGLSFSVSGPAGVSIDSATGRVSFDTEALAEQTGTAVTVTAANSGGSVSAGFALSVAAPIVYSAAITGLTDNPTYGQSAEIGSVLTGAIANLQGTETVLHRWLADGAEIAGATGPGYTPVAGNDLALLHYAPLVNGTEVTSPAVTVRHAPPVAGSLAPVTETQGSGTPTVNLAAGFAGQALVYSENVAWAAISGSTLIIDDAPRNETLTITATNSGGQAQVSLSVTIVEFVETRLVLTIETTLPGETFTLPLMNAGTNDFTADMGDGRGAFASTDPGDSRLTGVYGTPGIHTVTLGGVAHGLYFRGTPDAAKLRTVENLGDLSWQSMLQAFDGCSGMTRFTAGNTDTSNVANWYGAFFGCSTMTTCDVTGMSFASCMTLGAAWRNCTSLTFVDTEYMGITLTTALQSADECFGNCPALTNTIKPQSWPITGLNSFGANQYNGGFFDFIDAPTIISTPNYDATLLAWAAQLPRPVPFDIEAGEGFICDFQQSQPTMGGAVEAARAALINAGYYMEDAESVAPDRMAAPALTVDSETQMTITRGARPFAGGLPIRHYDYRYSTDETNWTVVSGAADDQWTSKVLTGLTLDTQYYVQIRARAPVTGGGPWSPSALATTLAGPQPFAATRQGSDLILTDVPDISPQSFTAEVQGADLVIRFTAPIVTPAPTQVAVIDAANHDGTSPNPGSHDVQIFDLGAGAGDTYTLTGAGVPIGAMVVLLDPRSDVVGGGAAEFERVVFVGASIMAQTFGSSLSARNAQAEAAFEAQGAQVEVYAHATGGSDAGGVQTLLSEAMAAFPEKTLFFVHAGGNNVTTDRPWPGGQAELETQLNGLIDLAATRPGSVVISDLSFRDYGGTTAGNEAAGSRPYNDSLYLPAFQARSGDLLTRAYYADGTPVSCLYEWSFENRDSYLGGDNIHPANPGGRDLLRNWLAERLAPLCLGLPAPAQFVRTSPPPAPALDIFVEYGTQTASGVNTPSLTTIATGGQTSEGPFALLNSDGSDPGVSLTLNFSAPAPGNSSGFGINTVGNGDGAAGFDGTLYNDVFTGDSYFVGAAYTLDHVISGLTPGAAYQVRLIASRDASDSRETRFDFANGETGTIQTTADPTAAPLVIETVADVSGTITITQSAVSGSWSYLGGLRITTL